MSPEKAMVQAFVVAYVDMFRRHLVAASVLSICAVAAVAFTVLRGRDACAPVLDSPPIVLSHAAAGLTSFYREYNNLFKEAWLCRTGQRIDIKQSFGASGDLMREIIAGEDSPDIISMSNPYEMDTIAAESGVVPDSWREEFPYESSPYYTVLIFAVRDGNPKQITDWEDLTQAGLTINVSDPQTCGGGRWVYTGVLGQLQRQQRNTIAQKAYIEAFYRNVRTLYGNQSLARDAFVDAGIGDVLVSYEAAIMREVADDHAIDVVLPDTTVIIDMPVGIGKKYTEERGTTAIARAYIEGLYEPDAQRIIAESWVRPRNQEIAKQFAGRFPTMATFSRTDVFSSTSSVEEQNLGAGGSFESIK